VSPPLFVCAVLPPQPARALISIALDINTASNLFFIIFSSKISSLSFFFTFERVAGEKREVLRKQRWFYS
jgi:hypothetical protein